MWFKMSNSESWMDCGRCGFKGETVSVDAKNRPVCPKCGGAKETTRINYVAHPGQQRFHDCTARFRMVAPGRRWGKTYAGAIETIKVANTQKPGTIGFVIAPSYSSTSLGKCWRTIKQFAPHNLVKEYHKTPGNMYIEWIGDRMTLFRSAEAPESCEGEGISYAWFDEPGKIATGEVWDSSVMPSLIDQRGIAWFTGTPTARAMWYRALFDKGKDRMSNPDYWSYSGSSYDNTIEKGGYLRKEDIDFVASKLSERSRQQNIYGMWLEEMGCVFHRVDDHVVREYDSEGVLREYSGSYWGGIGAKDVVVVGCDVAKHADWTVCLGLNDSGLLVAYERFHEQDWGLQQKRIANFALRCHGRVLIDSQGVGDSVYDNLRGMGADVEGYRIKSNPAKVALIENLALMMENNQITFPNITELVSEMKVYGFYTKESGTTTYEAPEGYHDDTVVALALAAWQLKCSIEPFATVMSW